MKTNQEIQKSILDEIKWDSALKDVSAQIGVSVNDGVVTLSGRVEHYNQKVAAEKAAQRVAGVKVVASDIEVVVPGEKLQTDTDIAIAVRNALKWHSSVNEDLIEVKVEKGWVYLDGTAEWEYQKKAAESAVQDLLGVCGVLNRIKVRPTATPKDVKNKIEAAFQRQAALEAAHIIIEADGGKITLKGKVHTLEEKNEAERAAWSAPGVQSIFNKIEVEPLEILV